MMYVRVYNEELVTVYEEGDLKNSEIIGKIKGRLALGLSVRQNDGYIHHDIGEITAKELQLIIRKRETITIAIVMTEEEILDYFYDVASGLEIDNMDNIDEYLKMKIDAGIVNSKIFVDIKEKLIERLK